MKKSRRIQGQEPEITVDYSGRVTPEIARSHTEESDDSSDTVFEMAPTREELDLAKVQARAQARRDVFEKCLQDLKDNVAKHNAAPQEDKPGFLVQAKMALKEGKSKHEAMLELRNEWEDDVVDALFDKKEEMKISLRAVAAFYEEVSKKLKELMLLEENNKVIFSKSLTATVKMPEMKLDTFENRIEDYYAFRRTFMAVMAKQADLPNSTKLHFLRGQLKGAAKNTLAMIGNSDADYDEAWRMLDLRFGDKEQIKKKLIEDLYSEKQKLKIKGNPNPIQQRDIHYKVRSMWQRLIIADEDMAKQDAPFRTLISDYYGFQIKKEIEQKTGVNPSVKRFLDAADTLIERDIRLSGFRDTSGDQSKGDNGNNNKNKNKGGSQDGGATAALAGGVQAAGGGASNPKGGGKGEFGGTKPKAKNNQKGWNPQGATGGAEKNASSGGKGQDNKCVVCQQTGHGVGGCPTFQAMKVEKRLDTCRKHNLCFRCLHTGHLSRDCQWAKPCKIQEDGEVCGKNNHHALLHRPKNK